MSFTKQEWNNGTIYRVHVIQKYEPDSATIDVPLDVAQSELVGKVFIGVENYSITRYMGSNSPIEINDQIENGSDLEFWGKQNFLCLSCPQLPPDIDYVSNEETKDRLDPTDATRNLRAKTEKTNVFARLPLPQTYIQIRGGQNDLDTEDDKALFALQPVVTQSMPLNKGTILTEMTNNPLAISNGRLRIQLLDQYGNEFKNTVPGNPTAYPWRNFSFTLVIYKPRNTYN
jgi:hypothetical protein